MKLWRSFCMALTMYSKLPAPQVEWREENMAYAMCFFPAIGGVIALLMFGLIALSEALSFSRTLAAALLTVLPLAVTGGIHMDGFCDVADARSSHAPREKKLEIMKDPRAGAFAVIACGAYLLLAFGLWHEAPLASAETLVLALCPVLSRGLSALAVVTFRGARKDGLLAAFRDASDVRIVRVVSALWIIAAAGMMLWRAPLAGGAAVVAAGLAFLHYRLMAYREFGGATGDLAGYFVQVCELACLFAVVLAEKIGGLL